MPKLDLDTQWAKIRKKVRYEKCQNKILIISEHPVSEQGATK